MSRINPVARKFDEGHLATILVAPIGGLAFIAGWVCLALAALMKSGR